MEIEEEVQEPSSMPPKLSLFSQRFNKPDQLQGGFTSPSHSVATIPFQWEEAPGKPRFTTNDPQPQKSNSVRSLDLPPRMFNTNNSKSKREEAPGKPRFTTNDPQPQKSNSVRSLDLPPRMFNTNNSKSKRELILSPTTVLDGPDVETHSSCWVVGKSNWKIMKPLRKIVCKETSRIKYSSWSWDGFGDISSRGGIGGRSGDTSFSTSFDDLSYSIDSKIKSNKVTRRRSLFLLDRTTSSILENMYEGINQVVPWRR